MEYYFGRGFTLRYRDYKASYQYREDMPLRTVEVMKKNGWQVMVDGVSVFADDKLTQIKSQYEHIKSKKKKAVDFPTIGVFTIGCGEKKWWKRRGR